jgi:hypothetical protein
MMILLCLICYLSGVYLELYDLLVISGCVVPEMFSIDGTRGFMLLPAMTYFVL